MEKDLYDIAIVGGGPAGMTAAIYAARADKKVVLFEKDIIGGQMVNSPLVENYPGFEKISGEELGFKMQEQVEDLGVEIIFGEVVKIVDNSSEYIVCTKVDDEVYACRAKTVILANGVEHKKLGVAGEDLANYCAICDGPFYKGKDVCVIGDGNTAAQYALLLANYCKSVTMITLFDKFFCEKVLQDRILNNTYIKWVKNSSTKGFLTERNNERSKITAVVTDKEMIPTDGVFVAIGQVPNETFTDLAEKDIKGYIIVNEAKETSQKGIFACGDITAKKIRQIATAINDGAIAATSAIEYLNNLN